MPIRKLLLGTSALVGASVLSVATPGVAGAAEVKPGGALDVTMSGFIFFRAHSGDIDNQRNNRDLSNGLDFSNDTEVHVIVRGKHDATGIEYGGTVEFEADTNRTDNTDESWIFVRGGFGEFRFGDEDGVVDNSSIGAYTIAAGTGGIDGSVIDAISISAVRPSNSDDSTKIRYYTPSFGGFQLGVSYTPNQASINSGAGNGDTLAGRDVAVSNLVEGAAVYTGDFAGLGIQASVVGSWGKVATPDLANGDDKFWTYYGGAATNIFGFKVAGGFGDENVGDLERTYFNAGIGYGLGPTNISVTYGKVVDSKGYDADEPSNLVFSADVAVMPGLVLAGDVGYNNGDYKNENAGDDSGWVWVARLGLSF